MRHPTIAAIALVALTGCALVHGQMAADSEAILAQAGFQRSALDEPGLPSRQLVEDAGTYRFADPDFCRCVYTGGASDTPSCSDCAPGASPSASGSRAV